VLLQGHTQQLRYRIIASWVASIFTQSPVCKGVANCYAVACCQTRSADEASLLTYAGGTIWVGWHCAVVVTIPASTVVTCNAHGVSGHGATFMGPVPDTSPHKCVSSQLPLSAAGLAAAPS
jgi:hypothetical protein